MRVAIYARVSTERQERDQTIESQLTALTSWVQQHGHELLPQHIYQDQGYSGSRLDRPGLDRLRDAAAEGVFDQIVVLSPDRLARKYAYQVLLLEELRRVGCEVVFLHHPITDDPNDQLLLQIQGAIAEYERAVLGERFRRGKLQKARGGQYLAGRAPYGYRYVHRREGVPGHLVVDDAEAELVRMPYAWLIEERMTIRQILKRLNFGPWRPRSGNRRWSPSTVHHILADPVYTGVAYANRYRYVPPKKPRQTRGPHAQENSCRQLKPEEEWIPIPVPAIIDQETYERARAQLARNATLSFRNNTKHSYLLRCLLTCGTCGLAMFGRTEKAATTRLERRYYTCHGKDCILSAREQPCPQRPVKAEELEKAVWDHVAQLLSDPSQLLAQFQSFAQAAVDGDEGERAEAQKLQARIERLGREESRLIDAYQAEVIDLAELTQRRQQLAERRRALAEQQEQQARLRQERAHAQEVLEDLTAFCERIRARLSDATLEEKQEILQLLIERVIVGEDTLEIRHVIPLRSPPAAQVPDGRDPRLRSDGVEVAALVVHPGQDSAQVADQPSGSVAGYPPQLVQVQPRQPRPPKHPAPRALAIFLTHHHRRPDHPGHRVHKGQHHLLLSLEQPRPQPVGPHLHRSRHPFQLPGHRFPGLGAGLVQPPMDRAVAQMAPLLIFRLDREEPPDLPSLLSAQQRAHDLRRPPQGTAHMLPVVDGEAVNLSRIRTTRHQLRRLLRVAPIT